MPLALTHLIGSFPVLYERALLEEMLALERAGVKDRIVAFHASGRPTPSKFAGLAKRVEYLDIARDKGRFVSGLAGIGVGIGYAFLSPRLASACAEPAAGGGANIFARRARLGRILRKRRPDLVHAQFGHLGMSFLPVIEEAGIPLVVSFRGQDVLLVARARAKARRRLFDYASRVLVRSQDMRNEIMCLDCPEGKVFVHPSGIDVQSIPFAERKPPASGGDLVILMAGRLVEKKGMADGLRAAAARRTGAAGATVRIAGDGPERAALGRLASQLGIGDRVVFLGAIPREDLIREMLAAHVFLLPCRTATDGESEGVPNALKEAQATGLPVVSTRHAGVPECVAHGESGMLADEGDVDAIAERLNHVLSHPERWPAMGRRGRELVARRYDVATLAPELVGHYNRVVGEKSGS